MSDNVKDIFLEKNIIKYRFKNFANEHKSDITIICI